MVLVSCGAAKLDHPAPARELYTGSLFRAARGAAERSGLRWFIVSAKYGLLDPDRVIEPYDARVPTREREADSWAAPVIGDINRKVGQRTPVIILAGQDYAGPLLRGLVWSRVVANPLRGQQLGDRLRYLTRADCAKLASELERAARGQAMRLRGSPAWKGRKA